MLIRTRRSSQTPRHKVVRPDPLPTVNRVVRGSIARFNVDDVRKLDSYALRCAINDPNHAPVDLVLIRQLHFKKVALARAVNPKYGIANRICRLQLFLAESGVE